MRLLPALRVKRTKRIRILIMVTMASTGFVLLKSVVQKLGWDVLAMHPLFSALVAASVFLLSFLLNGVLSDYKESEKLPGELATALKVLALEVKAIPIHNARADVDDVLDSIRDLASTTLRWIKGEVNTTHMMSCYDMTHRHVVRSSTWLPDSTLKGRLMIEMAGILRAVNRIEVIRETDFSQLVYLLAYTSSFILCGSLVFVHPGTIGDMDNSWILFVLSWLLIFILHLISDLDNPFGFSDPSSAEDVDLTILESAESMIVALCLDQAESKPKYSSYSKH